MSQKGRVRQGSYRILGPGMEDFKANLRKQETVWDWEVYTQQFWVVGHVKRRALK